MGAKYTQAKRAYTDNYLKENTKNYAMKKEISKWAKAYKKHNKRNTEMY